MITLKKRHEFTIMRGVDGIIVHKSAQMVVQGRKRNYPEYHDQAVNRIGFTATKALGGAVKRNLAKRRMRALWHSSRLNQVQLGYDFVFIARSMMLSPNFSQISQNFAKAEDYIMAKIRSKPMAQ